MQSDPDGTPAYPEVFLAIDNCFASKRHTEPAGWASLISDLGIRYVEASADNECDPLYQGTDYLARWTGKVQEACLKTGITVCNLYSGHGTYSTLGLGHTEPAVRHRMLTVVSDEAAPARIQAEDPNRGLAVPVIGVVVVVPGASVVPITVVPMPA